MSMISLSARPLETVRVSRLPLQSVQAAEAAGSTAVLTALFTLFSRGARTAGAQTPSQRLAERHPSPADPAPFRSRASGSQSLGESRPMRQSRSNGLP